MPGGIALKGKSAEIKHGYQTACLIGPWELNPQLGGDGSVMMFSGEVIAADAYWLSQEPLEMRLPMGRTTWVWPEAQRVINDGKTIHAVLHGKPQYE